MRTRPAQRGLVEAGRGARAHSGRVQRGARVAHGLARCGARVTLAEFGTRRSFVQPTARVRGLIVVRASLPQALTSAVVGVGRITDQAHHVHRAGRQVPDSARASSRRAQPVACAPKRLARATSRCVTEQPARAGAGRVYRAGLPLLREAFCAEGRRAGGVHRLGTPHRLR